MNDSLPDDLAKLQSHFEHWRNTRKTRSPIPEDLLQAARALLDRYPISRVCRTCRLHPTSLHQRAKPASTSPKPARSAHKSAGISQPDFYRLPPVVSLPESLVSTPAAEHCRLLLERPDAGALDPLNERLDLHWIGLRNVILLGHRRESYGRWRDRPSPLHIFNVISRFLAAGTPKLLPGRPQLLLLLS